MPETKMFIFETLTVPSTWIALIVAFVVAYGIVRIRNGKLLAEILLDAFFYFIMVWKFSVILTNFNTVIKSPLSILYFHGGLVGFYLGLVAAGIRIAFEIRKRELPKLQVAILFAAIVTVQAVYQISVVFMNEGGLVAQIITVLLFTVFPLFVWLNIFKLGYWPLQLALLFIAVHLFVAAFQEEGLTGTPVLATIGIGLFFLIAFNRKHVIEVESEEQL